MPLARCRIAMIAAFIAPVVALAGPDCTQRRSAYVRALAGAVDDARSEYAAALGRYQGCEYVIRHGRVLPLPEIREVFAQHPRLRDFPGMVEVAATVALTVMQRAVNGNWCSPVPPAAEETALDAALAAWDRASRAFVVECGGVR